MGDKHVCSSCSENLEGKQHIKIVFENWPQEKIFTYHRKGKEYKRKRQITKEIITALCMKCLGNPERWTGVKELEEPELTPLFNYLAKMGKNPLFRALLVKAGPLCIVADCRHRTGPNCKHLLRHRSAEYYGLDELSCEVGHPGATLVRREREKDEGVLGASWLEVIRNLVTIHWQEQHGLLTKIYWALLYSLPMFLGLCYYCLVAYPFRWALLLKNKLLLKKAFQV